MVDTLLVSNYMCVALQEDHNAKVALWLDKVSQYCIWWFCIIGTVHHRICFPGTPCCMLVAVLY
jgi:hypothetical protein